MSQAEGSKKKSWSWMTAKKHLRERARVVDIKEREIWWCAVGENIGVEINGKNNKFERPVLVFKKISKYGFIGIPLTSQEKNGSWYTHFRHHEKDQYAALTQIRFFSVHRVYRKMGQIDDADYDRISLGLRDILFTNDTTNTSSLTTGVCGRENPEYDSIIPNQTTNVNSKNASSLTTGVDGRENPEYDSIIPPHLPFVKRLFHKIQKIFRQKNHQRGKHEP